MTLHTKTAGGVVLNQDGLVLVVAQTNNTWSLPKGHLDPGEDELTAAKREIYEESGIQDLELIKKLGSYKRYKIGLNYEEDKSELKEISMFLFKTQEIALKPLDPENPEAKWVDKNDVSKILTHKKDQDFFISILSEIS